MFAGRVLSLMGDECGCIKSSLHIAEVTKKDSSSVKHLDERTIHRAKNVGHKELEDNNHQPKSQRAHNHCIKNAGAKYLVD